MDDLRVVELVIRELEDDADLAAGLGRSAGHMLVYVDPFEEHLVGDPAGGGVRPQVQRLAVGHQRERVVHEPPVGGIVLGQDLDVVLDGFEPVLEFSLFAFQHVECDRAGQVRVQQTVLFGPNLRRLPEPGL
ncbi:MAG: hypothetical protein LBK95_09845 [Bifidobacteriaceae bacterium]|nr:hypothetical protein [Bifidobacteriaceae bacterium]